MSIRVKKVSVLSVSSAHKKNSSDSYRKEKSVPLPCSSVFVK